jgi:hypothetical protein
MRNLLAVITGFLVGGGAMIGLLIALPESSNATARPAARAIAMPAMSSGMGSMGSGTMASAIAVRKLTIQHVQRGCHVLSDGKTTAATMHVRLQAGQKLSILDMDVDAHQILQFGGPTHLTMMGGPMMMNQSRTLTFAKPGVYRLGTKTVEMKGGGGMDVKTIGPDNKLRLVVTVA